MLTETERYAKDEREATAKNETLKNLISLTDCDFGKMLFRVRHSCN